MINRFDEAVLLRICGKTKMGLHSHMPAEAFKRGFPGKEDRAQASIEKLVKLGYVQKHPTRGGMTYQLTADGRDLCRRLKEKAPWGLASCMKFHITRLSNLNAIPPMAMAKATSKSVIADALFHPNSFARQSMTARQGT